MSFLNIFRPNQSNELLHDTAASERGQGGVRLSSRAIRQLDRLQLSGSRLIRSDSMGQRPGQQRKPATDFLDHRMYVPGDDIRYVDWRASARHEQVFIRQGDLPKDHTIHILIDCSESMNWGDVPKNYAQLELAAAIGYLALINRDRLRVIPYGGKSNLGLGPISGKGQITNFLTYLNKLSYEQSGDLHQTVKKMSTQATNKGLVFILSDLLDITSLTLLLDLLPPPHWLVNVLHVLHPDELSPPQLGPIEMVDSETGDSANYDVSRAALKQYQENLSRWQAKLDLDCVENHAFYTVISSSWRLEREIIAHLRYTNLAGLI